MIPITRQEMEPIGDNGWCIAGGRIPDPDNPVMLINCPQEDCYDCPCYMTDDDIGALDDIMII